MRRRSSKPRSKSCAACGRVFTRRYPCEIQRTAHCSKRCEGVTKRAQFTEGRLSMVQAQYGRLTLREQQLFGWGYKLGYARHANRERKAILQAQRARDAA